MAVGTTAPKAAGYRDTEGPRAGALGAVATRRAHNLANYLAVNGLYVGGPGSVNGRSATRADRSRPQNRHGSEGNGGGGRAGREGGGGQMSWTKQPLA
jgi:hypothetical protein